MRDPILAGPKEYIEDGITYRITAKGGLHYMKGNSKPYFSVTGDIDRKADNGRWVDDMGGCIHDEIAKHFPHLVPLIAFHLRDIDGAPMHGGGNGYFWLVGGQFFPKDSWLDCGQPIEKRKEFLGNELMISPAEVDALFEKYAGCSISPNSLAAGRPVFMRDEVAPRIEGWKAAAKDAICRFGLKVYGDAWEAAA
jgi:hypothetical protein